MDNLLYQATDAANLFGHQHIYCFPVVFTAPTDTSPENCLQKVLVR